MLWFVGDYASSIRALSRSPATLARLLHAAGVDFGILYDGERNSGNDVRRVGEEGLFEWLAEQNIATLGGCEFERIVTSDPHSLNTLRNEYPELGGNWTVMHHTDAAARADRGRPARGGGPPSIGSPTTTPATWGASRASTTPHGGSSSCSAAR